MSSSIATVKHAGDDAFPLHNDGPSEDRTQPLGAAAMFALSDFGGAAGGATCFFKGSHPLRQLLAAASTSPGCRRPREPEDQGPPSSEDYCAS